MPYNIDVDRRNILIFRQAYKLTLTINCVVDPFIVGTIAVVVS